MMTNGSATSTTQSNDFWASVELIDFDSSRKNKDETERVCMTYIKACDVQLGIAMSLLDKDASKTENRGKQLFRWTDDAWEIPFRYGRQPVSIRGKTGIRAVDLHDVSRIYRALIDQARRRDPVLVAALVETSRRAAGRPRSSADDRQHAA